MKICTLADCSLGGSVRSFPGSVAPMDDSKKPAAPLSLRRPATPQSDTRTAVADLCTLAPWDELAAFRKEVQMRFAEVFEVSQERREEEARLGRICQQLETKVERFARQVRGLHSRSEVFEGHMTSQAKELDACRGLHDALRDKIQHNHQELSSQLSSNVGMLRADIEDILERRHGAALEAARRADRNMADELLRKMGELNEKLGANMLRLEEEVAEDSKKVHAELKSQTTRLSEALSAVEAHIEQSVVSHEAKLGQMQEEVHETARDIAATAERGQAEHATRLAELEQRVGKLQDSSTRFEARVTAEEQALAQKAEQLQELLDEGSAQTAASLVRVRSEADTTARDIVRALREELREELRSAREETTSLRDDSRMSAASAREQAAMMQKECFGNLADLKDELHTMCRDVVGMVDNVRIEARSNDEANLQKMHDELDARLIEAREQINVVREEARDACQGAIDRLSSLSDLVSSSQLRLSELTSSTARLQSTADDLSAESTRLRAYAETTISELRRELPSELMIATDRQDSAIKSQLHDAREESQHQLRLMQSDVNARLVEIQNDFEELTQRSASTQRAVEDSKVQLFEELRERAIDMKRQQTEEVARADDHIAGIRSELVKVATMARESSHDIERVCHRLIEESQRTQETTFEEALRAHREACHLAITEGLAEPRVEVKNLRALLVEQASESDMRVEKLASDTHKQTKTQGEDLKRELEDLGSKLEEQLSSFASSTRATLQEQRQELRQHIARQLDERLRSVLDRISEATGECKVMRRTEEDLGHRCDRLQKTCAELASSHDVLAQQSSATAKELLEIRAEMRAELRASDHAAFRERHCDRPLLRTERQAFTDLQGSDAPSFSARPDAKEESPPKYRSQSLDRWGWTGPSRDLSRQRPKTTFESVISASPVARPGSPSPPECSEDRWSIGARTTRDFPWFSDPLGSPPRGLVARARASLGSSPPRSPLSLHTARGSQL